MLSDFTYKWCTSRSPEALGAHPASYTMSTGGGRQFRRRKKRPGREADHSPPSTAELKNVWSYTSILHTPSWRGAYLSIGTILPLPPEQSRIPFTTQNTINPFGIGRNDFTFVKHGAAVPRLLSCLAQPSLLMSHKTLPGSASPTGSVTHCWISLEDKRTKSHEIDFRSHPKACVHNWSSCTLYSFHLTILEFCLYRQNLPASGLGEGITPHHEGNGLLRNVIQGPGLQNTQGRNEKCIQYFGRKTSTEETTRKT
jgi:hypothetical protein